MLTDTALLDLAARIVTHPRWADHRPGSTAFLMRYPLPDGGSLFLPRLDLDQTLGLVFGVLIEAHDGDARRALEATLAQLERGPGAYARAVARALLARWGEVPAADLVELTEVLDVPTSARTERAFIGGGLRPVLDVEALILPERIADYEAAHPGPDGPARLALGAIDGAGLYSATWAPLGREGYSDAAPTPGIATARAWLGYRRTIHVAPPSTAPVPQLADLSRRRARG